MSVMIEGVDMPVCCKKCFLAESSLGFGDGGTWCRVLKRLVDANERPDDCPVHGFELVPPKGKTIEFRRYKEG